MQKIKKTVILNQDKKSIQRASKLLIDHELVSFPTETVYGLGASAVSNLGVGRIFAAKGRPKYNPLIIHIANKQDVYKWAIVPREAEILIEEFWPGPLTLVLNQKKSNTRLAPLVTANQKTIAIRVPLNSTARALISETGVPIAAPSANISGRVSPTRAKDVLFNLGGKISAVIKGDNCSIGLESTIVGFFTDDPILLRPGGITEERIEEKLGRPLLKDNQFLSNKTKLVAPGMMTSHYAPKAKLILNQKKPSNDELFLGFGEMPKDSLGLNLSKGGCLKEAATNFFSALTDLDSMANLMNLQTISVAPIPNVGLGIAINDRLKRATAEKTTQNPQM